MYFKALFTCFANPQTENMSSVMNALTALFFMYVFILVA